MRASVVKSPLCGEHGISEPIESIRGPHEEKGSARWQHRSEKEQCGDCNETGAGSDLLFWNA